MAFLPKTHTGRIGLWERQEVEEYRCMCGEVFIQSDSVGGITQEEVQKMVCTRCRTRYQHVPRKVESGMGLR
jgi:predicted SprT family Zn-dependent metalloprotease